MNPRGRQGGCGPRAAIRVGSVLVIGARNREEIFGELAIQVRLGER